ncbi:MAG: hypothetical protein RLZZ475_2056 [Pseudomonadota bacterium]|jgi:putative transposase
MPLPNVSPSALDGSALFYVWRDSGLWQTINHLLAIAARQIEGREGRPPSLGQANRAKPKACRVS